MIEIIPAISVVGNKVARINPTNLKEVRLYEETPLDLALRLQDHGVKRIHLLDLDGAREGRVINTHVLETISGYTDLTIDFGGGITFDDQVRLAFEYGADTINAATVAVKDKELFSSWLISFGRNKIILSADATHDMKVYTRGWFRPTETNLMDLLEYYHTNGIMYVKCTNIERDGQLQGPDMDLYKKIRKRFPDLKLLASGGIRNIDDIRKLEDIGVHGVIFAKALYEGAIKFSELEDFI